MDTKRVIVVKLGGSVFDSKDTTVQDVVALQKEGWLVVLVHGGAAMVTRWLAEQGIESRFYQGERITDAKSLEVVTAVLAGLANKEATAAILQAGGRAVGVSGVDGALIQGTVRNEQLGYLGDVVRVNPALLKALLLAGFIPVVSPVSLYAEGRTEKAPLLLNINGDTVAGEVAAAMGAEKLIFLTDVDGIHDSAGHLLAQLSLDETEHLLASGVAYGGMIPKLKACLMAAGAGAACYIVDGRQPHAIAGALRGEYCGTIVRRK
jgi:acetylglutamate kinase